MLIIAYTILDFHHHHHTSLHCDSAAIPYRRFLSDLNKDLSCILTTNLVRSFPNTMNDNIPVAIFLFVSLLDSSLNFLQRQGS